MGLKFIPVNYGPTEQQIHKALMQFSRRVYLRDFFAQAGPSDNAGDAPDKRLRVRNPKWHPLTDGRIGDNPYVPSKGVPEIVQSVETDLYSRLETPRNKPLKDNLKPAERKAINSLRNNKELVICEADKGMGNMDTNGTGTGTGSIDIM
eukprot:SAG31_NODE_1625_length_7716_cov_23.849941_7_plen_149_part_00